MTTVTAPLPLSDDHPDELLTRSITPPLRTDTFSLEEIYEIERTIQLLREGEFRTIALQFPDDLLHDAAQVSRLLQNGLEGVKTFILADTSYGRFVTLLNILINSCCVDEVAAEHINADVVVHYGRACLSPYLSMNVGLTVAPPVSPLFMSLEDVPWTSTLWQSSFRARLQI